MTTKEIEIYSINTLTSSDNRHHQVDSSFYKNILETKLPNAELIFVDDCDNIAKIINSQLPFAEQKLSEAKERNNKQNDEAREYNENFKNDQNFRERVILDFDEDHFSMITSLEGIILPCRHAEYGNLYEIIKQIKGSFNERLKVQEAEFDRQNPDESTYFKGYLKKETEMSEYFFSRFGIPVFEAFKFVPGYRFNNEAIGIRESDEEKMKYVEFAFNRWLEKNFLNKKS